MCASAAPLSNTGRTRQQLTRRALRAVRACAPPRRLPRRATRRTATRSQTVGEQQNQGFSACRREHVGRQRQRRRARIAHPFAQPLTGLAAYLLYRSDSHPTLASAASTSLNDEGNRAAISIAMAPSGRRCSINSRMDRSTRASSPTLGTNVAARRRSRSTLSSADRHVDCLLLAFSLPDPSTSACPSPTRTCRR